MKKSFSKNLVEAVLPLVSYTSLEDFARRVGISYSTLRAVLYGSVKEFSFERALVLLSHIPASLRHDLLDELAKSASASSSSQGSASASSEEPSGLDGE